MAKTVDDTVLDAALDELATANQMNACSAQPLTYYEGVDPDQWAATTAYSLGDAVRPTTRDGNCYECTTAGTSGGSEPTWDTTIGNTTSDGTVVWTARNNYALASAVMAGGDFTNANGDTSGRKATMAQQAGESVHTTGTATFISLVDKTTNALQYVTTCTSQALTSGNTVTFPAWDVEIADPT